MQSGKDLGLTIIRGIGVDGSWLDEVRISHRVITKPNSVRVDFEVVTKDVRLIDPQTKLGPDDGE